MEEFIDNYVNENLTYDDNYVSKGAWSYMYVKRYEELLQKHKNCYIMKFYHGNFPLMYFINGNDHEIKFHFKENDLVRISFIKELSKALIDTKYRFIIIHVTIIYKDDGAKHANVIIIDKLKNIIERFEPHGSSSKYYIDENNYFIRKTDSFKINENLKDLFKILLPKFYFVNTDDLIGPQHREKFIGYLWKKINNKWISSEGYCGFWVLFYVDLRLSFPDTPIDELLKEAYLYMDKHNYSLFIDKFAYNMETKGNEFYKDMPTDFEESIHYIFKRLRSIGRRRRSRKIIKN